MGTVEVQTAFHGTDLSCSSDSGVPNWKSVVLCSTSFRSLCFTWAVWKSRNCGWTWVGMDMVGWSSCAPQIWNTPKRYQTITFQSLNRKRCPGLEKYSGWAQSCTSWDGFSWNKFTIITTLGFLISPSMICRTSLWTIGACPFLSLQRRPVQPTDRNFSCIWCWCGWL